MIPSLTPSAHAKDKEFKRGALGDMSEACIRLSGESSQRIQYRTGLMIILKPSSTLVSTV